MMEDSLYLTPSRQDPKVLHKPNSSSNSTNKLTGVKKVGIDLDKVDTRASVGNIVVAGSNLATPKGSNLNVKNYGKVTEQLHH